MSSHPFDYLDGNAAAGELSNIFALDVTAADGQCAQCGATKPFAEARLYMQGPGLVARCGELYVVRRGEADSHVEIRQPNV